MAIKSNSFYLKFTWIDNLASCINGNNFKITYINICSNRCILSCIVRRQTNETVLTVFL